MELANRPQCYHWHYVTRIKGYTVTWTGECSGGLAQGEGTLTRNWASREAYLALNSDWLYSITDEEDKERAWNWRGTGETGYLQDGKKHGHWVERYANGNKNEGPYMYTVRHGHWVLRGGWERKGPYVGGKKHGKWVEHDGVREGLYVDGRRFGKWVHRHRNGNVSEGYLSGGSSNLPWMQGKWVTRDASGKIVKEGFYVNDKLVE